MNRLRQVLGFLRPFRGPLILALCLAAGLSLVGMAPPLLMRRLINDVAKEGQWGIFPLVIGLLIGVPILRAVINVANGLALREVHLGIIATTRKRLFRHLMNLSLGFYDRTPAGSINERLMADVGTIAAVATGGLITTLTDVITVVFSVTVMLKLSWQLSLATFALMPLYYLNYRLFTGRIRHATLQLRSNMDHISSSLQERLSAHELIQSYGQEEAEATLFSSRAKQVMDAAVRGQAYSISFDQVSAFINKVGNTGIYCLGCYFLIKGTMAYGDVVAFAAYATQLLGPLVRFASVANQIVQVGVAVDRINEILDTSPAVADEPQAEPVRALDGDITVQGVTFQYEDGTTALEQVDLRVPAGTHLAVTGHSGSGRTTLAMLLRRFYDPDDGLIGVDGTDIRQYRLRDYRRGLALILSECGIFDGTIRSNLLYGKPDASEARMCEVTEAVGLSELVSRLRDGYDTRVGTGGLRLPAGVQQQIGVGRALLSEPLILIADQATASLDPESADRVIQAVRETMEGRTCLIMVHRLLLAREMDSVVVLDEGKVAETGTHAELIAREGSLDREMFAKQYGDDQLPPVDTD